jgi:hypothetical protein
MSQSALQELTADQLIARLVQIGLSQDDAQLEGDISRFNRLYDQMREVDEELRARGREARLMLLQLYEHPNIQVRLNAAGLSLGVAPKEARLVLENIAASGHYPQAGDAGMLIGGLEDGTFRPT